MNPYEGGKSRHAPYDKRYAILQHSESMLSALQKFSMFVGRQIHTSI